MASPTGWYADSTVTTGQAPVHLHVPPWQLNPAPHFAPQAPQLFPSVFSFTSQPLAALPSQSPKPVVHVATAQLPAVHEAVALVRLQTVAQPPQLRASC